MESSTVNRLARNALRKWWLLVNMEPAGERVVGLVADLAGHLGLLAEAGFLVDEAPFGEGGQVDEDDALAGPVAEDELVVGDRDVRIEVGRRLAAHGPVPEHLARFGIDLEGVLLDEPDGPVLPVAPFLGRHPERDGVEEVLGGMDRQMPAGRRELDPSGLAGAEVVDADLLGLARDRAVHAAIDDVATRRGALHGVGELQEVRAEALALAQAVQVEAIEVVADRGDELGVVEPDQVRAPAQRGVVHLELERGDPVYFVERGRVVEQEVLAGIAEEPDGPPGVDGRGVARGGALEVLHLVGVGIVRLGRRGRGRRPPCPRSR